MPRFDFDAALREFRKDDPEPEPVTFLYGGEDFTVVPAPMLGDVMDLAAAPDPTPENEEQAAMALVRFIRRLLPPADRPRFDQAGYRIPAKQAAPAIIQLATWLTEQVTGFPTQPPDASVSPLRTSGRTSNRRSGGTTRSSKKPLGSESPSSTAKRRGA